MVGKTLKWGEGMGEASQTWDFRVCRACMHSSPLLGINGPTFPPSMGCRGTCPPVTSHNDIPLLCLGLSLSLFLFFFP